METVDLHDPQSWKVHLAVIQPTPFCNINCRYCYLPHTDTADRMSMATAEKVFRFLFDVPHRLAEQLVIAWHAGEPLTVPLHFYESALELQKRLAPASINIENSLQTNAMLLNQRWCEFISRHDLKVGVSIDGPAILHDANRVDRSGRGTFSRVMRGIDLLRANEIEFSTIAVLSESSLDHAEEIWRFFRGLGTRNIAFNCEDVEGRNRASSLSTKTAFERVQVFFSRLLELRAAEDPSIAIRELDYFIGRMPHSRKEFRRIDNVPLAILNVAWNGDVSTFSPELLGMRHPFYGDFVFGNVAVANLESIIANPRFLAVYQDISAGIDQCKAVCNYFRVCGGGQPSSKLSERGTFAASETLACQLNIQAIAAAVWRFLGNPITHFVDEEQCSGVPCRI
jgi:uncharacterized protein